MPPAGFEPAISALKGLCPRPLDDGGMLRRSLTAPLGLGHVDYILKYSSG